MSLLECLHVQYFKEVLKSMDIITDSTSVFLLLFICFSVWSNLLAGSWRAYFKDRNKQRRNIGG
jgi:hypothetical protein